MSLEGVNVLMRWFFSITTRFQIFSLYNTDYTDLGGFTRIFLKGINHHLGETLEGSSFQTLKVRAI
jgi:hypothetical protein